jgi:hypothetical protein
MAIHPTVTNFLKAMVSIPSQPMEPLKEVPVQQADKDASWRLLQRMYVEKEMSLEMFVFGPTQLPIPAFLSEPNNPTAKQLTSAIYSKLVLATTLTTVGKWHLNPDQVDQLQTEDPRIKTLRQRLADEITSMIQVQDLRVMHLETLLQARQTLQPHAL